MTSTNSTTAVPANLIGEEITVWVGAPGMARGLSGSGLLLVVEAEPERAHQLRQVLMERPEALVCEEVLAANNGEIVRWNRFNDARLSGPVGITLLRERFPNLEQNDQEERFGRSLGDLLDNWAPCQSEQGIAKLHIVLRQGDPLAALAGLGPWHRQLETVQLILPWPEEVMPPVQAWLSEHGFCQDPQNATLWKLDPIAKGNRLLQEKENENQALIAANQQLHSACEAMRADKEFLAARLEEVSAQWQELRKAQDLVQIDIQKSQDEAEKFRNHQEALQLENQQLATDKLELLQRHKAEEAADLNIRLALKSLFPIQLYREGNIDLSGLDEDGLVLHYVEHGRGEGRLKTYQELDAELKSSQQQNDETEAKLERLEEHFRLAQQQIETLKDVFAKLANNQHPARHNKEK